MTFTRIQFRLVRRKEREKQNESREKRGEDPLPTARVSISWGLAKRHMMEHL